jgi:tRNA splicing ligase
MPAISTAYVKNIIRRGFSELVDPSPDADISRAIWTFFESQCAYCGTVLNKQNKEGHIDHLVSASKGGSNHVSNRVLSCSRCNEAEKLASDWQEFLQRKAIDQTLHQTRHAKILQWRSMNPPPQSSTDAQLQALAKSSANEVIALYEAKVKLIKQKAG